MIMLVHSLAFFARIYGHIYKGISVWLEIV
jgi:hypothetical protein